MSQLIMLRVLCERCERAEATLWCTVERVAYCGNCDRESHTAQTMRHVCVPISSGTAVTASCALCREAPAAVYAASARALVCDLCAELGKKLRLQSNAGDRPSGESDSLLKDSNVLQNIHFERMDFSTLTPKNIRPGALVVDSANLDLTNELSLVGSYRRRVDLGYFKTAVPGYPLREAGST